GFGNGTANRHVSAQLYIYEEAVAAAIANNPRVRMIVREIGPTVGGRKYQYSILSTPANVARVEQDAQFYREVRAGAISRDAALADIRSNPRPALGWITETPHGNEPAGGEATARMLYELAARTDCANMRRLQQMTFFLDLARNPDGRDQNAPTRTTAWGFDPNRDLMYQSQDVNQAPLEEIYKYPGLFFIDAHQQAESYFFPPNEDPVHHEISHFALDEIANVIGPAIQNRFNDQSLQYRNYNEFDLFVPEFGDSVSSLILGSAGMTYEKGSNESYGKQVYDHYLAIDETVNVVTKEKDKLLEGWIAQWQEATEQGANCELQDNVLVSPLHDTITQQPPDQGICGYYFKPGNHAGDTAHVLDLLQRRDVHVYRLDQPTTVTDAYDWGSGEATTQTLPAGTLWVPTAQTMKHWINATLEENPYIPYPFFFDVVNWSFPDTGSAGGNGQLLAQLPPTAMTEVTGNVRLGVVNSADKPVLAFSTDSMEALGLLTELLDKGASVFRSAEAFDAAGTHFPTGTALVDAATLGGIDLAVLAAGRETPVTGLDSFPVARFQIDKPKIAVYTGAANVPTSPLFPGTENGHCRSTAYCEMLFTLSQKMRIPASMLTPVTTGDIANGVLTNQNFTALVSLNTALAATGNPSPASGLQRFVNGGGNYIVSGNNGATSMRNAGMSRVNTASTATWNEHCPSSNDPLAPGTLLSPGTAYNADFDTRNPVAWGFDAGGYIWRESSSTNADVVLDPATLPGNGTTIADAATAVSYPQSLEAYGFECNGLGADRLPGRPYVVDQPFGAGHSVLIGSNPFFRAWSASTQRLVFNGILYPRGAAIAPAPAAAASASKGKVKLAAKPLSSKQLPKVKSRPVRRSAHRPTTDVVLTVKRGKVDVLERIVRKAHLPAKVSERIRWDDRGDGKVSMTIVGAADFARNWKGDASTKGQDLWIYTDRELRPAWAWRIINGLIKHRLPHQDQI
ncbi:MAG TPA: M14 family zinc carboxypeptidase, partial [Croceibacterium sp.]|nr:M14 family zinc carboxypeptidase [Croceibacterium sp.]